MKDKLSMLGTTLNFRKYLFNPRAGFVVDLRSTMSSKEIGRTRYGFVCDKELPRVNYRYLGKEDGDVKVAPCFVALR